MEANKPLAEEDRRKPAVLVVEDDPLIREVMCEILEDANFLALGQESTAGAVKVLDSGARIDAAFVDIDLGDKGGGFKVAQHAREVRPDLVVVYTSGGGQPGYVSERVEDSVFVQKPYLPSQICELLKRRLKMCG
jgi:DNA-binding NtrC family response regulator